MGKKKCNILVCGSDSRTIVRAFIASPLVVEGRYHYQEKGTKGNVTIQTLPREIRSVPADREKIKAINEAHAFIFTANAANREFYNVKQKKRGIMGPSVVLYTYKTDNIPTVPDHVIQYAKENNMEIVFLNISNSFSATLEKIIANLELDVIEERKKKRSCFLSLFSSIINPATTVA